MTNEEKARVLSNKGCLGVYISTDMGVLATEETKKRLSLYGACLEAMQWKEQQLIDLLRSEVLPAHLHGGEIDEVLAELDRKLKGEEL